MLEIWGRGTSSNVQALMWCVGELGLPLERHDVGHRYGGNDTPEFLAIAIPPHVPEANDSTAQMTGDPVPRPRLS
jgi:glutathione S-transferase